MSDKEKAVAETAAPAKTTAVQEKKPETVVYCGPTIKGIAAQGTVFVNGLPDKLTEKVADFPVLKGLIVPRSRFAETRARVEKEGTAENILFKKAVALLK